MESGMRAGDRVERAKSEKRRQERATGESTQAEGPGASNLWFSSAIRATLVVFPFLFQKT